MDEEDPTGPISSGPPPLFDWPHHDIHRHARILPRRPLLDLSATDNRERAHEHQANRTNNHVAPPVPQGRQGDPPSPLPVWRLQRWCQVSLNRRRRSTTKCNLPDLIGLRRKAVARTIGRRRRPRSTGDCRWRGWYDMRRKAHRLNSVRDVLRAQRRPHPDRYPQMYSDLARLQLTATSPADCPGNSSSPPTPPSRRPTPT